MIKNRRGQDWVKWVVIFASILFAVWIADKVFDLGLFEDFAGDGAIYVRPPAEEAAGADWVWIIVLLIIGIIALILLLMFLRRRRRPPVPPVEEEEEEEEPEVPPPPPEEEEEEEGEEEEEEEGPEGPPPPPPEPPEDLPEWIEEVGDKWVAMLKPRKVIRFLQITDGEPGIPGHNPAHLHRWEFYSNLGNALATNTQAKMGLIIFDWSDMDVDEHGHPILTNGLVYFPKTKKFVSIDRQKFKIYPKVVFTRIGIAGAGEEMEEEEE